MDEIIPNLWLGSYPGIRRLRDNVNGIQSILSILRGKMIVPDTFVHLQIPLDDTDNANIMSFFLQAIEFIQTELNGGKRVLVHCQAGISRSPTIVAAYLMYSRNIDRDAALAVIQRSRKCISPNDGFMFQLERFHQLSFKVPKVQQARKGVKSRKGDADEPTMIPQIPDLTNNAAAKGLRHIRCKMCRQVLATKEHLVLHGPLADASPPQSIPLDTADSPSPSVPADPTASITTSSDTPEAGSAPSQPSTSQHPAVATLRRISASAAKTPFLSSSMLADPKCSGYFLDKMPWMDPFLEQGLIGGKIICPNEKCGAKLGNYAWAGVRCGCTEWITPGFCISRSKVDEITPLAS